jgi:KaiC/GvpD/RAD55 family RecA-like ATPase
MPRIDGTVRFGQQIDVSVEAAVGLLELFWRNRLDDPATASQQASRYNGASLGDALSMICQDIDPEACGESASRWAAYIEQTPQTRHEGLPTFKEVSDATIPGLGEAGLNASDVRYYAMRTIRKRYGLDLSSYVVGAIHRIAASIRRHMGIYADLKMPSSKDVMGIINDALVDSWLDSAVPHSRLAYAYVHTCLVLGLLIEESGSDLVLRSPAGDPEYLMSNLFGVPTSIPGFDALFGGGGLMLADSASSLQQDERLVASERIGGRAILVIGPFGSGKSLLSLQFAVDVAKKGGVAWVIAMEQTYEECLYSLEAIGISTRHPSFEIVEGLTDSFLMLLDASPGKGALVFLRIASGANYSKFLQSIQQKLAWMDKYSLRLLVVDPVNAFIQADNVSRHKLRQDTRKLFEAAKSKNVNVWLTSEQMHGRAEPNGFEENVADTVIHLGIEKINGQQRRFIEVTKSRFQQEHSGRHALMIESEGMSIYPASALFQRLLPRIPKLVRSFKIDFAVTGIENLLGTDELRPGDLVALAGPGKAKTLLGLQMLLPRVGSDEKLHASVFVSDYSKASMDQLVHLALTPNNLVRQMHIEYCSLQTGYIEPSRILLDVQKSLEACEQNGTPANRILLTNLARWTEEMPYLSKDAGFGSALVALLRHYGVFAIAVCGDQLGHGVSTLRDSVISKADFLLHFYQCEFKGSTATLVKTLKSRLMRHRRDTFELIIAPESASIQPAPLIRVNAAGEAHPVTARLFLNAETVNHKKDNEKLGMILRTTLSPESRVGAESRKYDLKMLEMAPVSGVDELQVFQLDEFQLPTTPSAVSGCAGLVNFDFGTHGKILDARLSAFTERVICNDGQTFLAVPFYGNISFFAVEAERFERAAQDLGVREFPQSWGDLVGMCNRWEERNRDSEGIFFGCPVYDESIETYNCLFLEILSTLFKPGDEEKQDFALWLERPSAQKAALFFRSLCRRSHILGWGAPQSSPQAIVWRHWYNTLNQALSNLKADQRATIEIRPLYGDITTAGEWYLSVPAHSASPEVALKLIEQLTTPERDIQRVELGIGLPTHRSYYESPDTAQASVSRYFNFSRADVFRLFQGALRRSSFRHYQQFASTLSSHLQWILDIPEPTKRNVESERKLEAEIQRTLCSLVGNIRFLQRTAADEHKTARKYRSGEWNSPLLSSLGRDSL